MGPRHAVIQRAREINKRAEKNANTPQWEFELKKKEKENKTKPW